MFQHSMVHPLWIEKISGEYSVSPFKYPPHLNPHTLRTLASKHTDTQTGNSPDWPRGYLVKLCFGSMTYDALDIPTLHWRCLVLLTVMWPLVGSEHVMFTVTWFLIGLHHGMFTVVVCLIQPWLGGVTIVPHGIRHMCTKSSWTFLHWDFG